MTKVLQISSCKPCLFWVKNNIKTPKGINLEIFRLNDFPNDIRCRFSSQTLIPTNFFPNVACKFEPSKMK